MLKNPNLNKYLDKKIIEIEKRAILQILNKENDPKPRKKKLSDIFDMKTKCPKGKKVCNCKKK